MQPTPRSLLDQWPYDGAHEHVTIGLVNNMPDAALRTTDRQFCELLSAAAQELRVRLRIFSIPDVPREAAGRSHVAENHEDIGALWDSRIDGLIVTGTEPRAPNLSEEPYWPVLTRLADWAEQHTVSTIWSCLAAHAAVLHRDGIRRHALPAKLSGLYECVKLTDHALLAGIPARWRLPHSRCNGLSEEALASRGYRILSRSPEAGVDLFARQGDSLFLFVHGHPEYDPGALFREYRRDVGRFLAGERDTYPAMPVDYFDQATAAAMTRFRDLAFQHRRPDIMSGFPVYDARHMAHAWRGAAVRLYANWLFHLASQIARTRARAPSARPPARVGT